MKRRAQLSILHSNGLIPIRFDAHQFNKRLSICIPKSIDWPFAPNIRYLYGISNVDIDDLTVYNLCRILRTNTAVPMHLFRQPLICLVYCARCRYASIMSQRLLRFGRTFHKSILVDWCFCSVTIGNAWQHIYAMDEHGLG